MAESLWKWIDSQETALRDTEACGGCTLRRAFAAKRSCCHRLPQSSNGLRD
jgi:hypothetical protein